MKSYRLREQRTPFGLALLIYILSSMSLAADGPDQLREERRPFDWRDHVSLRLSALAAGLRFIPDPGERSYLEDAPAESGTASPATAEGENPKTDAPRKYRNRFQSFGLVLRAGDIHGKRDEGDAPAGPDFYYRAELGIFFQEGAGGFRPPRRDTPLTGTDDARDESRSSSRTHDGAGESPEAKGGLKFYPGNDLFVAFRTGDALDLALGRRAGVPWRDDLAGGHGPLTGLHVSLANEFARLQFSPYHRHALAGNYLPREDDPVLLHGMGRRQHEDLATLTRGSESYGQSAMFSARWGLFRIGLNYAVNRQQQTARLPAEEGATPRVIDRIEYTGGGLGLGNDNGPARETDQEHTRDTAQGNDSSAWSVYLHFERSLGFTRALSRDLNGDSVLRIDGRAARAGAYYRSKRFSFELRLFLPEPATLPSSSNAGGSGYIGYGDGGPRTPLLSSALDTRPAPILCRDRRRCTGLEIRSDQPGFANHAALGELSLGWRGEHILLGLDAAVLRPLAPRRAALDPATDPAELTPAREDENGNAYLEAALTAGWRFPAGRLRLQYARLIEQRERTGATRLAGEALYLMMEYEL